jgi:sterol desaturase/sphingolipid hydroxylase (fatty acid hydroxylase superfamily)
MDLFNNAFTVAVETVIMDLDLSSFEFYNAMSWPLWVFPLWGSLVALGFQLIDWPLPIGFGYKEKEIAVKGKHLDELEFMDSLYINMNKCATMFFMYHLAQLCWYHEGVEWDLAKITVANTLGSLMALYITYDLFYHPYHRFLHVRLVYKYVHKHHHRQKAPSRGHMDTINAHPFEFIGAEYLNILAVYLVPCHVVTVLAFIVISGLLATLNHTRYDLNLLGVYSVKAHDVHHRIPQSNYSQYTVIFDKLWGTFRPYEKVMSSMPEVEWKQTVTEQFYNNS